MPEETPYRWLNREGRWPAATTHGLHRDGEHWTLPVVALAVGDPWVSFTFEPAGAAVELWPLADGGVTVVDRARGRVVRVRGDGVPEVPEGAVVPPAQPEDAAATAARARVNGVAAAPAPDGWGSDFVVVTLAGAVFLVPTDPLEPERQLARVAAGLAGVAVDHHGLLLLAGPAGLYRPSGPQRGGRGVLVVPAPHPGTRPRWDRVQVELAEPAPAGTHVRIWTLASRTPHSPAGVVPGPPDPTARDGVDADHALVPTPADRWRAGPLDCPDIRVLTVAQESAPALWMAVELLSDGRASPRLADVRVACAGRGLLDQLPTAYTSTDNGSGRLGRILGLFAAVYEEVVGDLDRLTRLLDSAVTPDRPDAPWLARLAAWVDACPPPLDTARQQADSRRLRERVAGAFAAHARRGTPAALVEAVRRETGGVEVELYEPLLDAGVWRLGDKQVSALGATTRLTARTDSPVLDSTAVLDESWLIDEEDRGLPLYAESAHRVHVLVPGEHAHLLATVRRVVERERPAHVVAEFRLRSAPPP
jgi:phage tail-like protein